MLFLGKAITNSMAMFSRRRLQLMLDSLRPKLDSSKIQDFTKRLSKRDPDTSIAAEMELALLWGVNQCADLRIEPELASCPNKPEAFSEQFFNHPAYFEVTTHSDGNLSGEQDMERASKKIVEYVNRTEPQLGEHLYFNFKETSFWKNGEFNRKVSINGDFDLNDNLENQISSWIQTQKTHQKSCVLNLCNEHIDVSIQLRKYRQIKGHNYSSSMPAIAYNIKNNPLFRTLTRKAKQLSGVPENALKVIFLADGGSRLIRMLFDKDPQNLQKSGAEIIQHFLSKSSVNAVCVFSPYRMNSNHLIWQVSLFCQKELSLPEENIKKLSSLLPQPRFEGYQARSLEKQGAFLPLANSWYIGTQISTGKDRVTMKLSSRLLQEYLAGNLEPIR